MSRTFPVTPACPFQHRPDTSLIGGAKPGNIDAQPIARHLQHGDAPLADKEVSDRVFPGVGLGKELIPATTLSRARARA